MPEKPHNFWQEMKRRKVIRVITVYAAAAFVILELVDIVAPSLGLPAWTLNFVIVLLCVGLVLSIILSWIYDITPEGIQKTKYVRKYQKTEKPVSSYGWKIGTYVSLVVIIGLLILNIVGRKHKVGEIIGPEKSILVLPFENFSTNPDQDYFCDGMTEEVITDLSRIHDLLVISRNTTMTFKGTTKMTKEIASEANVRYVLEGSVRKDENNVRITAQLIDAETDTHLWAENYSGTLDDIFDIQEKVSRSIANELRIELSPEESSSFAEQPINNLEAYEYYLKARQEIYRFSEEGLDRAIDYLERGLQIAGENPLLYSCMGNAYFQYWNFGIRKDEFYLDKARECAERIYQIEPDSYYGRMIIGLLQSFVDPQEAIKEFKVVLEDDPYNEDALLWLCVCNVYLGLNNELDPFIERLVKKDPLNSIVKVIPGLRYYFQGEFELALDSLEKVYLSNMNDPLVLYHYGRVMGSCNMNDKAILAFNQCAETLGTGLTKLSRLFSLALQNKNQEVITLINPEMEQWAKKDWLISLFLAECLSLIGETNKAIEYLEQSVNLGCINYPFLNEYDVFLNSIQTEERFREIMEQVKLEWQRINV